MVRTVKILLYSGLRWLVLLHLFALRLTQRIPGTYVQSEFPNEYVDCQHEMSIDGQDHLFTYRGMAKYLKMGAEVLCSNQYIYEKSCRALVLLMTECQILNTSTSFASIVEPPTVTRAVIVEPRRHPALHDVISNVCEKLQMPITLFHGQLNVALAKHLYKSISCLDTLVNIEVPNLDTKGYNALMMSDVRYWSKMNASDDETILVFQTDSGICGTKSFTNNLKFHYCGGAWPLPFMEEGSRVGNGGFSIRNKGSMRRLLQENVDHRTHFYYEDALYSYWCLKDPYCQLCPTSTAIQFSAHLSEADHGNAWGFHRNWAFDGSVVNNHPMLCDFNNKIRLLNQAVIDESEEY